MPLGSHGHLSRPDVSQMPARCLPDASQMPPRCLPDDSQMVPRFLLRQCLGSLAGILAGNLDFSGGKNAPAGMSAGNPDFSEGEKLAGMLVGNPGFCEGEMKPLRECWLGKTHIQKICFLKKRIYGDS